MESLAAQSLLNAPEPASLQRGPLFYGLLAAFVFYALGYLVDRLRWEVAHLKNLKKSRTFENLETARRAGRLPGRRSGRGRTLTLVGVGMAVLGPMLLPAPANANEFNLADRLWKNLATLSRMQAHGAAILTPTEFRTAWEAHEQAMRHAGAIVRLRALQVDLQERRRAAERAGLSHQVKSLDALNRWILLEVIEHDSEGVAVCETVDAVAHRFAILRWVRWMLRENGYDAPELSGPDLPRAFRERVKTYVAAIEELREAQRFLKSGVGDPVAQAIARASAQEEVEEAALSVHRAERPELYPVTAWRR